MLLCTKNLNNWQTFRSFLLIKLISQSVSFGAVSFMDEKLFLFSLCTMKKTFYVFRCSTPRRNIEIINSLNILIFFFSFPFQGNQYWLLPNSIKKLKEQHENRWTASKWKTKAKKKPFPVRNSAIEIKCVEIDCRNTKEFFFVGTEVANNWEQIQPILVNY